MRLAASTTFFIIILELVKCSRILIVFPMVGKSHYILGNALARGLAEAGHDVTMVSPFEDKSQPPKNGKLREIVLTGLTEEEKKPKILASFLNIENNMNSFMYIPAMISLGNEITRNTFAHQNFQKLLDSKEHFDAVILQQFATDALTVLAYHYKAPIILFSTLGPTGWINDLVGNPSPLSYIPDTYLNYTCNMTFLERLVNFLYTTLRQICHHWIFSPYQNNMMHEYFPEAPHLNNLLYNVSLVLLNSHISIKQAIPYVPNMIDIGGFHIKPPKKLPTDLKEFMDNATEGVVYFSLGSNLVPSQIPKSQRKALTSALGKLKQKVLLKWNEDTLDGKPNNVKLSKWFPQPDILAHLNTKLFITHGGLLSTIETIYHGMPVLALPVFADQKMNAANAVQDGYGLALKLTEFNEKELSESLDKLLNDPRYRNNAKWRSKLMHDRPVKPMDLAVYWTEFVIRHKGAPHLRVVGVDLPYYKYYLLDVITFIIFITISVVILAYVIVRKIYYKSKRKLKKA